jgi:hypothetical protein
MLFCGLEMRSYSQVLAFEGSTSAAGDLLVQVTS